MRTTGEILTSFNKEIENYIPMLPLWDRYLNESSEIRRHKLPVNIGKTEIYLGSGWPDSNILQGTEFNVLFWLSDPASYLKTKAVLNKVKLSPGYDTSVLPEGYSGICLIDFPEGIPAQIADKLPVYDGQTGIEKQRDPICLTTIEGINKLLELINKETVGA